MSAVGKPAPPAFGSWSDYALCIGLAMLAGAVDAVGFVHWHGLFVSFMSGNSTTLGAAAGSLEWRTAGVSLAVIGGFVAGVALGETVAVISSSHARSVVLLVEAMLLGAGAIATRAGFPQLMFAPLLSLAMGVQNASVHRAGGISVALTYVTGTLVHVGRSIAAALRGEGAWSAALPYLGLWCGLVAGAVIGARLALRSEELALATATGFALLFAAITAVLAHRAGSLARGEGNGLRSR